MSQTSSNHSKYGLMQDQSIWGNPADGELVRSKYFLRENLSD